MDSGFRTEMVAVAREFVHGPVDYTFTPLEQRALAPFFSNHDRRIFFMSGLPESVAVTLLAMYSRLKNPRGLRGHFVDHMVPILMFAGIPDDGTPVSDWRELQRTWKAAGLNSLDAICGQNDLYKALFRQFVENAPNAEYWRRIADSPRLMDFKKENLDKYGDKSIIRPARILACFEDISILLAKLLEDLLQDHGIIELSTRYVTFTGKSQYPIHRELELIDGTIARIAAENIEHAFGEYRRLAGTVNFDGPFPQFLRDRWTGVIDDKNVIAGVTGEACDVLGNLLPCATLTQVGLAVSGEALGEQLLKTLYLEGTPEAVAVAEFLIQEGQRCGYSYFLRRYEPTPWERGTWEYLPENIIKGLTAPSMSDVQRHLLEPYGQEGSWWGLIAYLTYLDTLVRDKFDTLPDRFRGISVTYRGAMSFRGWRDTERQSMSIHRRSRVSPVLGFYQYPKPAFPELGEVFRRIHSMNEDLYMAMRSIRVPEALAEYPMAMGNLVNYRITSDLKWAEFNGWQRTKWVVNDEVRQEFLKIESLLRQAYPWWTDLSRADMTPHYVFARGATPVILPSE